MPFTAGCPWSFASGRYAAPRNRFCALWLKITVLAGRPETNCLCSVRDRRSVVHVYSIHLGPLVWQAQLVGELWWLCRCCHSDDFDSSLSAAR